MQKFGFNADFLEKLKYNNDLVSVISKYVNLKQSGNTYWGCCPFHHEKTPSFAVNSLEQYYHCFGCGKSGDVIKFIEEMESIDFIDAVKLLADNAHMDLPEVMLDENIYKKKKEKEEVLNALKEANNYYQSNLEQSENAVNYIKKRGISGDVVKKFELGYSKDFSSLVKYLNDKKISNYTMKLAGLVGEKNGHIFDSMFERLTFPIKNSFNEVIGFSSRILDDNPKLAKYKNSPQTIVFDKSKVVFGIQFLKQLKNEGKLNEIIIVEGQMDVIGMHNAGFINAVATMGTAFTQLHAKELKRFCNKIILCFDGDSAGQKATLKAIDVLKNEDFDIYCVTLPENLDPDEYVKKYGTEKMHEQIQNAKDCFEYRIINLSKGYNLNDKLMLSKFIKESLNIVREIKTNSEREIYLKLIKDISKVAIDVLKRDLMQLDMPTKQEKKENFVPIILTDNVYKSQLFILASLLHKKPYAKFIEMNNFNNFSFKTVYEYLKECNEQKKEPIIGALFDSLESDDKSLNELINYQFSSNEIDSKYFEDCEKILKLDELMKQQTLYTNKVMEADNIDERKEYGKLLQEITKEISKLKVEDKID